MCPKGPTGTYVLDFGQDVSKRAPQLSLAPGTGIPVGQIVGCSSAASTCSAIRPGSTAANTVLVTTQDVTANSGVGGSADQTFTATMIAG